MNSLKTDIALAKSFSYIITGDPTPLARPRFAGPSRHVYDSQKILKHSIIHQLINQHAGRKLFAGACRLDVIFYLRIPKTSITRMKTLQGQYHVFKPDLSNLIKFVEDVASMRDMDDNEILIKDDCIISSISAKKIYDLNPRTEFTITELI
jgi:Holliday junction resolvase RusA-like endonuclease